MNVHRFLHGMTQISTGQKNTQQRLKSQTRPNITKDGPKNRLAMGGTKLKKDRLLGSCLALLQRDGWGGISVVRIVVLIRIITAAPPALAARTSGAVSIADAEVSATIAVEFACV